MDGIFDNAKAAWAWLPQLIGAIGGVFGAIFYAVQLYESRTFQHWKNNFLLKHRARKLARLQARAVVTAAQIAALEKIRLARREARELVEEASCLAAKTYNVETTKIESAAIKDKLCNADKPPTK